MPVTDLTKLVSICEEQEKKLVFTEFSGETAWQLGSIIRKRFLDDKSMSEDRDIVIQIKLYTGHLLFAASVETHSPSLTGPDNWEWVKGKEAVTKRFAMSSFRCYKNFQKKGKPFGNGMVTSPEYVEAGGCFPINIKGLSAPIGTITVSGMPDWQDHQIIVDSIAELLAMTDVPSVA